MIRATRHLKQHELADRAFDTILLVQGERHLRRKLLKLRHGDEVMVDLPEPVMLEHGDMLVLEDGRAVEIIAAEEELLEIVGRDALHLIKLAWHLGNRHLPAQIEGGRILIQRDHVINAMLEGLGRTGEGGSGAFPTGSRRLSFPGRRFARPRFAQSSFLTSMSTVIRHLAIATMTEVTGAPLLRLMTWLSPAFPVGAFSYSHGIERAVEESLVRDRETLTAWLSELLVHGSAWNDAVLLAESWREPGSANWREVTELAEAMAGSRERYMETNLQGEAFLQALSPWSGDLLDAMGGQAPYPVAVGAAAALHGIALEGSLIAYLHAFASNLVQAAVRLVPLGQRDGVATMAALEQIILETARRGAVSTLDDLGSATFMSEIMSMKHETQYSRVFRS